MIYTMTCAMLRFTFRTFFGFKAYGMENIPTEGSFIMAPNHVSYLDPLVVGAFVPRKLNYIAKKDIFKGRLFSWYLGKLRTIPIDNRAYAAGMRSAIKKIKNGEPIVIFPEGTRTDGSYFNKPRGGVAYLSLRHN